MAKDPLAEAGLHFDELNKLRVLEPDVSQKTTELKEECEEFVDSESFLLLISLCYLFILTKFLCFSQYRSITSPFAFENRDRTVSENCRWAY